ncbi:MAG: hypothetical protein AB8F78_15335 [Saprospiraceae bacterium]
MLLLLIASGLYEVGVAQIGWGQVKKIYMYDRDTVLSANASGKLLSSYLQYSGNEKIIGTLRHLENDEDFQHIQGVYLSGNDGYFVYLRDRKIEHLGYPADVVDYISGYQLFVRNFKILSNKNFGAVAHSRPFDVRKTLDFATQVEKKYTFSNDPRSKDYVFFKENFPGNNAKVDLVCLPYYQAVDLYVENNTAYVFTMCGDTLNEYHIDLTVSGTMESVKYRSYNTPKLKLAYNHLNVFYKSGLLYVQFGEKLYLLNRRKEEDYWLLLDKKARFPMTIEISGPFGEQTLLR